MLFTLLLYGSMELVSLKGVIISHEYRLHHSTISAPLTSTTSNQQLHETIIALRVQSQTHPDSVMLYYSLREGQPHPLCLLPGAVATFHSVIIRTSKGGNIYCESTGSSSITLHCMDAVWSITTQIACALTPQMLAQPPVYLSELRQSLLSGSLTRRIICVRCRLVSVQRVSLHYKCLSCDCTIVDGVCMAACPQSRPTLKAEGRYSVLAVSYTHLTLPTIYSV